MSAGRSRTRTAGALAAAFFCCLLLNACGNTVSATGTGFAMGSPVSVTVYAPEKDAQRAIADVNRAVDAADRRLSATLPDAEIARLNETGDAALSEETEKELDETLRLCAATGGALDVTLGAATALWGFATDAPQVPEKDALAAALATRGLDRISPQHTLAPGQKLDMGAVGKGAGCDAAKKALDAYGFPAVLSFGGTVLLYGQKPGGAWSVGIRDPFGTANEYFAMLDLQPGADGATFVSTSGSYEKTFTENGKTYHHILDPETGYPVETDLIAVTAVGENGLAGDALSTALFVNGLNAESLAWVARYLRGAAFVFSDGSVYVTEGLREAFTLINTDRFTVTDAYEEPAAS